MAEDNVIIFDPIYLSYKKMWINDRWSFSGELVRLTIKQSKGTIDDDEQKKLKAMNRILDENNNNWNDGYYYRDGVLTKSKSVKKRM